MRLVLGLFVIMVSLSGSVCAQSYTVTDLGVIGGRLSVAVAVNDLRDKQLGPNHWGGAGQDQSRLNSRVFAHTLEALEFLWAWLAAAAVE